MKKNDLVEVTIESMGSAGEGIGKMDGYPLFVKDTFPGDKARVSLTKVKKTYAFAQACRASGAVSRSGGAPVRPAPTRGGCQIQGLSYEKQLLYKEEKVREDLKRLGGFTDPPVGPVLGMDEPYRYRNKAQVSIRKGQGGPYRDRLLRGPHPQHRAGDGLCSGNPGESDYIENDSRFSE